MIKINILLLSLLPQLAAGSVLSLTADNYAAATAGKNVFIKVRNDETNIKSWPFLIHLSSSNLYFLTSFVARSSLLHGK